MIVSVIIPVYKVEEYIRRCVQSVIDQDCNGFSIECILVDDASPDKSMDIVREMVENYQGNTVSFVMLHHDVNQGISAARNTGTRVAKGDYFFYMDSDDHILENTLKRFVAFAVAYPKVDVIMGNSLCMGINVLTNSPVTHNDNNPMLLDDKQLMWKLLLTRKLDHHAWNKLVKRSFVLTHNLMFDEGVIYEDISWTYRLMSCVSSILIVPELTYMYEYNPTSIVHTTPQKANHVINSFIFTCDSILSNPPSPDPKGRLFVDHFVFVCHWMTVVADLELQYEVGTETKIKLKTVKKTLFFSAVKHLRIVLALYSLTLFSPMKSLLKSRFYRSNLNRLEKVVYRISKVGDRLRF